MLIFFYFSSLTCRNTLTYEPLVELLSNGQFICWGGDVKDQEAWDGESKHLSLNPGPSTASN